MGGVKSWLEEAIAGGRWESIKEFYARGEGEGISDIEAKCIFTFWCFEFRTNTAIAVRLSEEVVKWVEQNPRNVAPIWWLTYYLKWRADHATKKGQAARKPAGT